MMSYTLDLENQLQGSLSERDSSSHLPQSGYED